MSSELIGREIDRYKILSLIGSGGMATVYKAYDTRLERDVAIKVIRREAFVPEDMDMLLKRFEREAKSLAGLSHPNIVGVIDFGEFEGSPYLVMEYVPGGTLKDWLGEPIPWRGSIQMILPIARALEYVHERGIINRDIKPSNILMTEKGQPMLTDFGLIKAFGEAEKDKDSTSLTSSGMSLGTPDYMAPEQWTGEATIQSDLYSLGVVLYEMITGHRPYKADTPAGVLLKQANEPLPLPKSYIPDLPQDVESVLLKVLAKEPTNRYPDMTTFISELQGLLEGRAVTAATINTERLRAQMTGHAIKVEPPAKRRKWILPAVLVLVVGAIVVFAGGYWLLSSNPGLLAPVPTLTQQVLPSPTLILPSPTAILPTETSQPEAKPTETPPPTEPALPLEIRDNKNVPMVLVPAGKFTMGNDDAGDALSRPAHEVYVDAFYIDKYEVTNEMYDACSYAVECRRPQQMGSVTRTTYFNNPVFANYPVIYVDWKMANMYCAWRGARLPTEAEWEKAARGTDDRIYPWEGDELDCSYTNYAPCVGDTTPVDQHEKGQSPYGVFGLAGNVWEWTSSLAKVYPYDPTDGREDPDAFGKRIARGGSWHPNFGGNSGNVRVDTRAELDPGYYGAYVGFRCVRSVDQDEQSP